MKRIPIYVLLLALIFAAPVERVNIGSLRPAEVIVLGKSQNGVTIETDTQDLGAGATVHEAVEDMRQTSIGRVYLDTVRYLLVSPGAEDQIYQIRSYLKVGTRLCIISGDVDLATVAMHLDSHGKLPTLRSWTEGTKLPILSAEKIFVNY